MNNITKIQRYLLWASFIGTFGEQLITPLYGIFVTKIGGGILEAGTGFAIFSLVTGFAIIATGNIKWFNDNTHLIVVFGFLLSGLGDFLYFFVTGTVSLFFVQALIGLSVGLLNPAWEALYSQESKDGEEHEVWSLWGGGANIATGIAALIGSLVAWHWGFKTMFVISGVINAVAVCFAYMVYKEKKVIVLKDRMFKIAESYAKNDVIHGLYKDGLMRMEPSLKQEIHNYFHGADPIPSQQLNNSYMKATKGKETYDAIKIEKDTTKDQVVKFVESFGDKYRDHFVAHAAGISLAEKGGISVNQTDVILRDSKGVYSMVSEKEFNDDFEVQKEAPKLPKAPEVPEEISEGPTTFDQEEYEESLAGYMQVSEKVLRGAFAKISKKSVEERKAIIQAMTDRKISMTDK